MTDCSDKLCERLWELLQKEILCDVHFDVDGTVVKAHRVILRAWTLNIPGLLESSLNGPLHVRLPDTEVPGLRHVLRYMYKGELNLTVDNVMGVYSLCHSWALEHAMLKCTEYLTKPVVQVQLAQNKHRLKEKGENVVQREQTAEHLLSETAVDDDIISTVPKLIPQAANSEIPESKESANHHCGLVRRSQRRKCKVSQIEHTSSHGRPLLRANSSNRENKKDTSNADFKSSNIQVDDLKSKSTDVNENPSARNNDIVVATGVADKEADSKCPVRCAECGKTYKSELWLNKHKVFKHSETAAAKNNTSERHCGWCDKEFYSLVRLTRHEKNCSMKESEKKTYISTKCWTCGAELVSLEDFREHLASAHPNMYTYECNECPQVFKARPLLNLHKFSEHWVEGLINPHLHCKSVGCNFKTLYKRTMEIHENRAHGDMPERICELCGFVSKNQMSLAQHMNNRHRKDQPKSCCCRKCDMVFRSKLERARHYHRIHKSKILCSLCPFMVSTQKELSEHHFKKHNLPLPTSLKSKLRECPYCDYKTLRPLKPHLARHTEEKRLKCDVCGKCYMTKNELTRHKRVHNPENSVKCQYCNYQTNACNRGKRLQEHIETMHLKRDYKPWECHVCDYKSNIKGNLTLHLRRVHKVHVKTNHRVLTKVIGARQPSNIVMENTHNKTDAFAAAAADRSHSVIQNNENNFQPEAMITNKASGSGQPETVRWNNVPGGQNIAHQAARSVPCNPLSDEEFRQRANYDATLGHSVVKATGTDPRVHAGHDIGPQVTMNPDIVLQSAAVSMGTVLQSAAVSMGTVIYSTASLDTSYCSVRCPPRMPYTLPPASSTPTPGFPPGPVAPPGAVSVNQEPHGPAQTEDYSTDYSLTNLYPSTAYQFPTDY